MMIHNFYKAKVIKVIHVKVKEGKGIEGDIVRIVEYYLTLDGKLLATNDPCKEDGK